MYFLKDAFDINIIIEYLNDQDKNIKFSDEEINNLISILIKIDSEFAYKLITKVQLPQETRIKIISILSIEHLCKLYRNHATKDEKILIEKIIVNNPDYSGYYLSKYNNININLSKKLFDSMLKQNHNGNLISYYKNNIQKLDKDKVNQIFNKLKNNYKDVFYFSIYSKNLLSDEIGKECIDIILNNYKQFSFPYTSIKNIFNDCISLYLREYLINKILELNNVELIEFINIRTLSTSEKEKLTPLLILTKLSS